MRFRVLGALLILLCWVSLGSAATLAWNPSARALGYRLAYGLTSGQYDVVLDTGAATVVSIGGLTPGMLYFAAAQAYNSVGVSDYSNEVSWVAADTDTVPPTVAITTPQNGSTVPRRGTVTVQAQASDSNGVTRVVLFVNGSQLCQRTATPYQCSWQVPSQRNRTYRLSAQAFDPSGNRGESPVITVTAR